METVIVIIQLFVFYGRKGKNIYRFKKIFGSPKDTIVCIGDWEQRKHRKFK